MDLDQTGRLALSLALGLLVGFQREWASKQLAGIRTFPLVTLMGALAAQLAEHFGGWVLLGGFLALAAAIHTGSQQSHGGENPDHGITTEVALLVMFAVGGIVALGRALPALATTGAVAVLLHWKRPLHDLVRRAGEDEVRSVMQLVLVGLVILPVLPDRSFGPFAVLNPFQIWSMVVLIVGISVAAYLVQHLVGAGMGAAVAGVLGGLVSSTATTVSYARRTRRDPESSSSAALVILLASAVVLPRVLLVTAVVAPGVLSVLAPPLLILFGGLLVASGVAWHWCRGGSPSDLADHAPSDLRAAIGFGMLYAAVLLGAAAARRYLGEQALYGVAALSGLTDVDAITLSTVQLVQAGRLEIELGWRLVLVGVLANLVFKGGAAALLGHRRLLGPVLGLFGAAFALGICVLYLWPR